MLLRGLVLVFSFVFSLSASARLSIESDSHYLYLSLLLSDDPGKVRLGVRSIDQEELFSEPMLDVVAQTLFEARAYANDEAFVDTASWLAKTLGHSTNTRYRPVLEQVRLVATDKKLLKYLKAAISDLKGSVEDPFVPGSVSLDEVHLLLATYKSALDERGKPTADWQVDKHATLNQVIQRVGYPDEVDDGNVRIKGPFFGIPGAALNLNVLDIYYFNTGIVRFEFSKDMGGWFAKHIWRQLPGFQYDYNGDDRYLLQGLLITDSVQFRKNAIQVHRGKITEPAFLDVIADRILFASASEDDLEVDGMAHLCGVIANSRNPRYRSIFDEIHRRAVHDKLKSYAAKVIAKLPRQDVEQYQSTLLATIGS